MSRTRKLCISILWAFMRRSRRNFLVLVCMISKSVLEMTSIVARSMRVLRIHWEVTHMLCVSTSRNLMSINLHILFGWSSLHDSRATCCRRRSSWKIWGCSLISEIDRLFATWVNGTASASCSCSQERNSTVNSQPLVVSRLLLRANRRSWGTMMAFSFLACLERT